MNELVVTLMTPLSTIQEYLKKPGSVIRFTKGKYNITATLFLYSDVTIILDEGAVLIRKNPSHIFRTYINPKTNYSYNAVKNVTIKGTGTLQGDGVKTIGSVIGLLHAYNINISGIKIKGTYMSHAIDVGASKKVVIDGVDFSKRIIDPDNEYKEEIQIDYAMAKGFPYFPENSPCYNDNHCEDLTIKNCKFADCNVCIGTHSETSSTKKHKNIQILNNTAVGKLFNGDATFIKLINTDGAIIKGNKAEGFSRNLLITCCPNFFSCKGVKFEGVVPPGKTGCNNVLIDNNTFFNAGGDVKAAGIMLSSNNDKVFHTNITVSNNKLDLNDPDAKFDLFISHADKVTVKANNTFKLAIKTDAATTKNITIEK